MTAPIRHQQIRIDPLAIFKARAEARAALWAACEIDLHEAVDALQADAVTNGLVTEIGQDAVQGIMADAFHRVREGKCRTCATFDMGGWAEAAVEYVANAPPSPKADDKNVLRCRRLLDPGVSLERAWHEIQAFHRVARREVRQ